MRIIACIFASTFLSIGFWGLFAKWIVSIGQEDENRNLLSFGIGAVVILFAVIAVRIWG